MPEKVTTAASAKETKLPNPGGGNTKNASSSAKMISDNGTGSSLSSSSSIPLASALPRSQNHEDETVPTVFLTSTDGRPRAMPLFFPRRSSQSSGQNSERRAVPPSRRRCMFWTTWKT